MAYAKINSVTNANMAKVSNVAKAAIGKIDNIDAPAAVDNAFTFTINTENAGSATKTFVLPLANDGSINFTVDWGDSSTDTITAYNQAEITHVYSSTGTYTVKLEGTIRGWYFNGGGDRLKILNISNWGDFNFTKKNAFKRCTNLTSNATDVPEISTGEFHFMFESCTNWNPSNIGSWDMSSVTQTNWMLFGCSSFNQPIGTWDTSSNTNISYMLYGCTSFNQNLANWDISAMVASGSMDQFMPNTTLSTANYDALLIGWQEQSVAASLSPHFGSSTYTAGGEVEAARTALIEEDLWTITDGGQAG
jgi:hypothetical protein